MTKKICAYNRIERDTFPLGGDYAPVIPCELNIGTLCTLTPSEFGDMGEAAFFSPVVQPFFCVNFNGPSLMEQILKKSLTVPKFKHLLETLLDTFPQSNTHAREILFDILAKESPATFASYSAILVKLIGSDLNSITITPSGQRSFINRRQFLYKTFFRKLCIGRIWTYY